MFVIAKHLSVGEEGKKKRNETKVDHADSRAAPLHWPLLMPEDVDAAGIGRDRSDRF